MAIVLNMYVPRTDGGRNAGILFAADSSEVKVDHLCPIVNGLSHALVHSESTKKRCMVLLGSHGLGRSDMRADTHQER